MRLELFEENVGGNLKEDIGNEEDGEGDIGLVAFEVQVFGQTEGEGVGDVDAVQEGSEVDEEEHGYDVHVYFSEESFLVDGRWTFECDTSLLGAAE